MSTLEQFLPHVLPSAPGVPSFAACDAIRLAAIEFCTKARVWQETQLPFASVADRAEYAIPCPANGRCVRIEWLKYRGYPLDPMVEGDLTDYYPDFMTERDTPRRFLQLSSLLVRLVPMPDVSLDDAILLRASYCPTPDATVVPDVLFERDAESIGHGALARLLVLPNKSWTNPDLAAFHAQQFQNLMGVASLRVATGYTRAPMRVRACSRITS